MTRLKKIRHNMIQRDQLLKYLHYHLMNQKKYEYFTGEYLTYKPKVVEQANFDYSPLGKIFPKGLEKNKTKKKDF